MYRLPLLIIGFALLFSSCKKEEPYVQPDYSSPFGYCYKSIHIQGYITDAVTGAPVTSAYVRYNKGEESVMNIDSLTGFFIIHPHWNPCSKWPYPKPAYCSLKSYANSSKYYIKDKISLLQYEENDTIYYNIIANRYPVVKLNVKDFSNSNDTILYKLESNNCYGYNSHCKNFMLAPNIDTTIYERIDPQTDYSFTLIKNNLITKDTIIALLLNDTLEVNFYVY